MASAAKQLKRWALTIKHARTEDPAPMGAGSEDKAPDALLTSDALISAFKTLGFHKYAFQLERGENGGVYHYQCHVSGKQGKRLSELKLKELQPWNPHWSAASGDGESSKFYALKESTRVEGPWTDKDVVAYIPHFYRTVVLRPHQQWLVDRAKNQGPRKILFVVDPEGGTGKTTLGMYLCLREKGIRIPASIKSAEDIMAIVMSRQQNTPHVSYYIILDIPRSCKTVEHWGKFLSACEDLKNGHVYDKRYSYKELYTEPPKIIITSNTRPPPDALTSDRFDIVDMLWVMFSTGMLAVAEYQAAKDRRTELKQQREESRKRVHGDIESDPDEDSTMD